MTATIVYNGNLRNTATHLQSGNIIETDAPTDNRGKGERFSPTDLVCVALATCIVTTLAMKAMDMEINIDDSTYQVTKFMQLKPRRIAKITVAINLTATVDEKTKTILERIGHTCPVSRSLSKDVKLDVSFNWGMGKKI